MKINKLFQDDDFVGVLFLIGIGILLIYIAIDNYVTNKKWENKDLPKRYTIGVITDFERGAKSPPSYKYSYCVDGILYNNDHLIVSKLGLLEEKKLKWLINKRFYVKFIADDPTYSKLQLSHHVPDSIYITPPKGWKIRPN